jgi:hypothetical protein
MLTIPTGELVGTLQDIIPFASTDKDLPSVHAVRLEWDGDRLHALATDRYVAGWSRWHPDDKAVHADPDKGIQEELFDVWGGDHHKEWQVTLDLPDAAEIVKVYRLPAKQDRCPLEVECEWPKLTIRRRPSDEHSAIVSTFEGLRDIDFPNVRALLDVGRLPVLTEQITYDAKKLATFAKVRYYGPLALRLHGPRTTTVVTIGERFTGAIMPTRLDQIGAEQPPADEQDESIEGQVTVGEVIEREEFQDSTKAEPVAVPA